MARIKTQISVTSSIFDKIKRKIQNVVTRASKDALSDAFSNLDKPINEAIEKNKTRFTPSKKAAGELGIGSGGSIDEKRRTEAWKSLLVGQGGKSTNVQTIRIGQEGKAIVGQINVSIDKNKFYQEELSKIPTPDSKQLSEIPWMMWLIEGKTIGGVRFSGKKINRDVSRTGRGIMINGGLWDIKGKGADVFDKTLDDVRKSINRTLKSELGAKILRRVREIR